MPRSPSDQPPSDGYGMFIRPFCPPVIPSHSTTLYSTTKPNAIVTMARYGPRDAQRHETEQRADDAGQHAATGSVHQKLQPSLVVRIAVA